MPAALFLGYNPGRAPCKDAFSYRRIDATNSASKEYVMSQELVYERGLEDAKQFARILYIAHAATFFFSLGLFNVVVLIINYIRRPETVGTMVYSHHTWMIRSFWWYVVWMILAAFLAITIIGIPLAWLVGVVAWVWMAYRIIKGFLDLNNNRPMPV
jgi:uncharacterized membrane protein